MKVELDVHTHTLASGHAYGTIREMAQAAAEKGLKILGITEHAKGIPGTCDDIYFENLRVVPREMYGIELLLGSEINILDYDGNLSLPAKIIDKLDIRIAGIHSHCYKAGTMEQNTDAVLKAIKNPRIDIISHPDDGKCPLDYEPIVKAAKENSVLLELNNNSLNPINKRLNARENNLKMLSLCIQYDVPILVSSDAHDPADIARYDFVTEVLNEIQFPEKLIVNKNAEKFKKFLSQRR
ncbi:phosphatase [Anaerocolumna sp. MB42-C2]|uniref:phosphatase n=1 Tax=Anaerocolumna sp. MB42-C2 TaxID=3070997 RepID=UPI0027E000D2|nr:phosphatase [Anaerocolumna sp. MB42-C2]WMJ90749.1 phosphatase [Anaerocolumna sp. MB42-C2]